MKLLYFIQISLSIYETSVSSAFKRIFLIRFAAPINLKKRYIVMYQAVYIWVVSDGY